jgi:hypothetical protein
MGIAVSDTNIALTDLHTRMPFSFGSVTIDALPHLFVELTVQIDGESVTGYAADHAVPKWFEKDPELTVADDIERIQETVDRACERSLELEADTPFRFWRSLIDSQLEWADRNGIPSILASFGVSFVERAVIDAVCRHEGTTFGDALRDGTFGIEPGSIYEELSGTDPAEALPDSPERSVAVRHTVGHDDPLTAAEIADPVADGLPQSLAEYARTDGVRYFKCKLSGDVAADRERLTAIADVIDAELDEYGVTVDANEQYQSIDELERLWRELAGEDALAEFVDSLICIEQPLDRSIALSPEAGEMLDDWDGPPIIIDESDGKPGSLGEAARLGYAGASVKSCKGVFKSVVNAALVSRLNERNEGKYLLTAEDLTTIGPVSLQQDLALVASLGFGHVERNGHHYFRGLDALPDELQDRTLETHGDLYRRHEEGFPTLDIDGGTLALDSVVDAPYGTPTRPDLEAFTPAAEWSVETLGL